MTARSSASVYYISIVPPSRQVTDFTRADSLDEGYIDQLSSTGLMDSEADLPLRL
jgi:hypothetical protein